ncbi:acylneuraminate cytidylyltransferase [Candidatus Marinamargulisbacteria bacterium SCGC AG-439-L15]|nr:acylneuraminate cytidylyltransferase [Candidatus Marinamargulisbacteria bacterium SCGC AG-439-L15]
MKAHSERIPQKNIKPFQNKPLFQWMLDSMLTIKNIRNIIINTDNAKQFQDYKAFQDPRIITRKRKASLCGDFVSMNKIIADDIQNIPADIYLMTHSTNPLLSKKTIESALKTFIEKQNENDSLFSVTPHQKRFYKKDGTTINHASNELLRTQDLETWYEENSCLYIFTKKSFESTNARIGKSPLLYETPYWESIDIDDPISWTFAELVANMKSKIS